MKFLNFVILFLIATYVLKTDISLEKPKTNIERPKVKITDNKAIEEVQNVKNSLYDYVKNSILNNKNYKSDDIKDLPNLQEYILEYKQKKKKDKEKEKEEYEKTVKRVKTIKNNLKIELFFKTLFSRTEKYYKNLLNGKQDWTENELEALNIIKNTTDSKNVLDKIDINITQLGYFTNAMKLIHNNEDVDEIENKIRSVNNLDIEELTKLYNELKKYEISFINLFSDKIAKKRFGIGDDEYNAYIDFRWNTVKTTNHLNKKFLKIFLNPYVIIFLGIHIIIPCTFFGSKQFFKTFYGGLFNKGLYSQIKASPLALVALFALAIPYFIIYKILSGIYGYFNPGKFYKNIAKKFFKIKTYINTIEKIYNKVQEKEHTFIYFKRELSGCRDLFIDKNNLTKDQIKMMTLMNKLNTNWGYWKNFGTAHRLCTFLKLFDANKHTLIKPILEIANLERYIKIYKMINDHKNTKNLCIPKFSKTKIPMLILKNAWNPILDINKVVKNDICLGKETPSRTQIGILYGMNAGGKSTISKTIGLNYIIGRSYGICFAQRAEMSYLKRLYIMSDIKDDINNNYSKFMSEIITTDKFIQLTKELKDDEHCLLISDELFSGTNPETANKLSVNLIKHIINKDNLLTLYSTHFSAPPYVANDNNNVKIYIMETNINENKINYTYKIKEYTEKLEVINSAKTNKLIKSSIDIAEALIKDMFNRGLIKYPDIILGYPI